MLPYLRFLYNKLSFFSSRMATLTQTFFPLKMPRIPFERVMIFPPAFLMGFPMPTAMTTLGRLGKQHMFLWAWGINGCFSVIGAALVPILATSFGLTAVLWVAGLAYLLAIPAFFAVLLPLKPGHAVAAS